MWVEGTRWAARSAAWHGDDESAATAATYATMAARAIAVDMHQLSGAIGFTEEYDPRLWTMRAQALRTELGGIGDHARAVTAAGAAEQTSTEVEEKNMGRGRTRAGAGGQVARLLLRAAVGGTMVAHGVKHGRSLEGTAGWFGSIGFRHPRTQALASAVVEIGSGAALVAGIGTPLAAGAVVGTMGVAAYSVHRPNGFFITAEGYEYVMNLAAAAVALAGLGAGCWSLDRALGWEGRPRAGRAASLAAGLGSGAAAAQLAAFHRPRSDS